MLTMVSYVYGQKQNELIHKKIEVPDKAYNVSKFEVVKNGSQNSQNRQAVRNILVPAYF